MTHLIDKDALVAEIKKLSAYLDSRHVQRLIEKILFIIDTLEVKEIDLEKEINKYISDNFFGSETMGFFANRTKEEPNDKDIALCAKHFYELGLKAQKGENV
jgi:hypothetical protein